MGIKKMLENIKMKYARLKDETSDVNPVQLLINSIWTIPAALASTFALIGITGLFIFLWTHASSERVFWFLVALYPIVMIGILQREFSVLAKPPRLDK